MKRLLCIAVGMGAMLALAGSARAQLKSEVNLNVGEAPVSGTNPIPVTSASGAGSNTVQGTAPAGSAPVGNPLQGGGLGADAKMHPLSVDNSGDLNANVVAPLPAGSNVVGKVGIDQTTPGTTNGISGAPIGPVGSSVLETAHVIKASAGALASLTVTSHLASPVWVLVLNAASDPGNGAVAPLWWYELPAASASQDASGFFSFGAAPLKASSGITVVCSTTGPFTETQSANCAISGQAL